MQNVSSTYRALHKAGAQAEVSVLLNGVRYYKDTLLAVETQRSVFGDTPTIGNCIAGEIDLSIIAPSVTIPRMAQIIPCVRLTDGTTTSEWVQKGVYYIDTRKTSQTGGEQVLDIHGYDAMLMAEQDYPVDNGVYPKAATAVVSQIATAIGVNVDSRTNAYLTGINIPTLPLGFSCREVLSNIAVAACGNFVMSDTGELRFIPLNDLPEETNLLVTEYGDVITFGGVGIVIG